MEIDRASTGGIKDKSSYFCYAAAEGIVLLSPIALGLKFRNDFIRKSFHYSFFL